MAKTLLGNNLLCVKGDSFNGVLVVGVVHGDEPQGKFLIQEYLKKVRKTNLAFIPVLNPDGLVLNQRVNSKGVDINRNFPTQNWKYSEKNEFFGGEAPASEVETQFLIKTVEELKPRLILTLHAPFKIVNYDGNARDVAQKIAKIIGYPVEESVGYETPGSFGTWAGIEKRIPTITLELDEDIDIELLKEPIFKIFEMLEKY